MAIKNQRFRTKPNHFSQITYKDQNKPRMPQQPSREASKNYLYFFLKRRGRG